MLSVPPAFVLSQDQTLNEIVSKPAFVLSQDQTLNEIVSKILSDSMILVCSTFISLCVQTFFRLLLDLNYFNYSKYFQGFRFVYCSIFKILTLHRPYAVQLYYHITLFAFCQAFFVIFFAARFLSDSLFIIPPFQGVFSNFEPFRELLHIHQKPAYFFVHSVKQTCKCKKRTAHCAVL